MVIKGILNRFYVSDMNQALSFYETLFGEECKRRFKYQQMNLELAQVGDVLILSGSDEALSPFKETKATFLVDSIDSYRDYLLSNGATIIRDVTKVPTGVNMTVRHPDGTVIEYAHP